MARKQFILITVVALAVVSLAGCGECNTRANVAQRRWDRVMEKARIEAAQESIEQGRLQYAIRLLEDLVESESAFSEQAKQILEQLKAATQEIAQARAVDTGITLQTAIN